MNVDEEMSILTDKTNFPNTHILGYPEKHQLLNKFQDNFLALLNEYYEFLLLYQTMFTKVLDYHNALFVCLLLSSANVK